MTKTTFVKISELPNNFINKTRQFMNWLVTLDLDSTGPHPSGCMGHTPTPFWSVLSYHLCFLPGDYILNKSLLTFLLQFVGLHGRPGPLLNPGTSQSNACPGMRWWSICTTCPSQRSLLSLSSMSSIQFYNIFVITTINSSNIIINIIE